MNPAHVHLILNHIPVIGSVVGLLLLIVATARRSSELKKVSLGVFVVIALIAIPVYLTGEPAEEVIEHLPGVAKPIIEEHEEMALISAITTVVLGVLALAGLFISRRSKEVPSWVITISLLLSTVSSGMMGWTANLGGQIRHTETRADFQLPPSTDK
ncbi:MAG: hypothetical protein HY314_02575 [Acidobacteria bacterium]|nr:hypothetical protein [Acidobacteriota bacterium]